MGFWDSVGEISSMRSAMSSTRGLSLDTEAKKTNNFDKYNDEYKNTQKLIKQKKETIKLVLKQDRFKTLKIKLEKMKKDI